MTGNLLLLIYFSLLTPLPLLANSDATSTIDRAFYNQRQNDNFKNLTIKEYLSLDSFEGSIQGYELNCEQGANSSIGFCAGSCNEDFSNNKGARVSKECADFLDNHLAKCLLEIGCKTEAAFCGVGAHAKRRAKNSSAKSKTRPSRHSTGDALDIGGLRCKEVNIDFTIQGRKKNPDAYDKFVKCYEKQARTAYKNDSRYKPNCGGALSCRGSGSTADSDGDHDDHIHISCPIPRKNVSSK